MNVPNDEAKKTFTESVTTLDKVIPTIYTDGSYDQAKGISGYGYIVCIEGEIIFRDSGLILDSDLINMQSLGSEVFALLRAMEWSISNGYKEICIVFDSFAILSLINNGHENRIKRSKGKTKFINLYMKYSEHVTVYFQHRSESEKTKEYHMKAHYLSRLPLSLLF